MCNFAFVFASTVVMLSKQLPTVLSNAHLISIEASQEILNGTTRIVGGTPIPIEKYPFVLSLQLNGAHICGASLVKDRVTKRTFVLSAAHCFYDQRTRQLLDTRNMRLQGGSTSLVDNNQKRRTFIIRKRVVNPRYNNITHVNDIAIVFISKPANEAKHIRPILLPKSGYEYFGKVQTFGWGKLENGNYSFDNLRVARMPLVNTDECARNHSISGERLEIFKRTNLCAGAGNGGIDACQGDSGGPLIPFTRKSGKKPVLIGVTSWGRGCGLRSYPGVYTKVSAFVSWIRNVVQNNRNF